MNSRLFYIFKRKFPPIIASYKAKSLKYLKHLPSKLKSPEQLPGSASLFLLIHGKALNIHYKNINSANEIFEPLSENIQINNDLFVGNLTREELLVALVPGNPIYNKLNDNEQSLAVYLNNVILNEQLSEVARETFTDSLICYLLTELRLNKRPFTLILQPDFSFSVFDKNVFAKVKFGIQKENTMIFIDEDKHIRNLKPSTEYGESQITAEILACAFTNFNNADSPTKGKSQMLYAMRVIGMRFAFYKAFLSRDYLRSLRKGFPPHNLSVTISRFPSNDIEEMLHGHDYADMNQRFLIVDLLYRLKESLLKIFTSLRKLNTKLTVEISELKYAELETKNIEVNVENAKLKQTLKDYEAKFVNLEHKDEEKAIHIAKLDDEIKEIKQSSTNTSSIENSDNTPEQCQPIRTETR
ncbi:hypothetical protein F8M41_016414 [Gigaspora margarita]|uniref:Uncharacterized protein n=1 Tax=Gigaspora margarita TaxID=4874 RepID=A0A8H4EMM2_GIGMA|nr:hypothetical protein F8M41_016414 [Gigaspora margarita]